MERDPSVLCINGGSSSLKFALYCLSASDEKCLLEGSTSGVAQLPEVFAQLARFPLPDGIGHRLVHGGPRHQRTTRVDAALLSSLEEAVPFAPLHLPVEIEAIERCARQFPSVPQVVCFDTAFHRDLPEVAQRLPLPRELFERGVKRYGFHGLSYEYVVEKMGWLLGRKAVLLHLGGGSSLVALRDGQPIDTTMGLTPTGGVMMGTRTGDVDPGVIFHLLEAGMSPAEVERMVNHDAGLSGVSAGTSDMQTLLANEETDARARLAIEMYCYQLKKAIGAFAAALGGLDTVVFTGGIGEHAAPVRLRVGRGLAHLGVTIDDRVNDRSGASPESSAHGAHDADAPISRDVRGVRLISAKGSPVAVYVVATNEQLVIARQTRSTLFPS